MTASPLVTSALPSLLPGPRINPCTSPARHFATWHGQDNTTPNRGHLQDKAARNTAQPLESWCIFESRTRIILINHICIQTSQWWWLKPTSVTSIIKCPTYSIRTTNILKSAPPPDPPWTSTIVTRTICISLPAQYCLVPPVPVPKPHIACATSL